MKPLKKISALVLILLIGTQPLAFSGEVLLQPLQNEPTPPTGQSADDLITAQTRAESLVESQNELLALSATSAVSNPPDTQETYYDQNGQVILTVVNSYDTNGKVTSQKRYSSTGSLLSETNFTYNAQGELTQQEDIYYFATGEVAKRIVSNFDNLVRLTDQQYFNVGGAQTQETNFTYSPSGRLSQREDVFFNASSQTSDRFVFTYDSVERLLGWSETRYSFDTNLDSKSNLQSGADFYHSVQPVEGDVFLYRVEKTGNVLGIGEYKYEGYLDLTTFIITALDGPLGGPVTYQIGEEGWLRNFNLMMSLASRSYSTATAAQLPNVTLALETLYEVRASVFGDPTHTTVCFYNPTGALLQVDEFEIADRLQMTSLYTAGEKLAHTALYNLYTGQATIKEWFFLSDVLTQPTVSRHMEYNKAGIPIEVIEYNEAGNVVQSFDETVLQDPFSNFAWFTNNQNGTPSGLIVSHPDDLNFIYHEGVQQEWAKIYANTQGYTYDQAVAGITMLNEAVVYGGPFTQAKKILDFYYAEWLAESANFTGFWTVYNVDPAFAWKKYEWRKGLGENAWVALFCLKYYELQTDPAEKAKGLALASAITKWIGSLPHKDGAVAMGPNVPGSNPNYGNIYSVENNLDYYAVLKYLAVNASDAADRTAFQTELAGLTTWLKTQAYDPAAGLFRRGGRLNTLTNQMEWDPIKSLDVNSWAISAIGPETLAVDFGIDLDAFMTKIGETFAVQPDGTFGGNILEAQGFDFSDFVNAAIIGRDGIQWVEGTNQMILAYQLVAEYYAATDRVKSCYYESLAAYFTSFNPEYAFIVGQNLSYPYASEAGVQIYADAGNWRTFFGQAAPSVGWVYFSLRGLNPFQFVN